MKQDSAAELDLTKDSEILLTSGAARVLGRSESLIRKLADDGVLPNQRTARGTRVFRMVDVLRLRELRG